MLTCFGLALLYPLPKRYVRWPQFVLAPTVGWPVFVGWISVKAHANMHENTNLSLCGPLFLCYASWAIYYDICCRLQDIPGDKEGGVGPLAQFLGVRLIMPFLLALNIFSLLFLGLAAERSGCSLFLKTFGLGMWAVNISYQLNSPDPRIPTSGKKIFRFNVMLGMYVTVVLLAEISIGRHV
jgi:4-hydroxybenzoate polyprenyltransferase